jgi:hypothetical protein
MARPDDYAGRLGYTSPKSKKVAVAAWLPESVKIEVVAHELGHIHCGHVDGTEDYAEHRGRMETEAEAAAYMAMRALGREPQGGRVVRGGVHRVLVGGGQGRHHEGDGESVDGVPQDHRDGCRQVRSRPEPSAPQARYPAQACGAKDDCSARNQKGRLEDRKWTVLPEAHLPELDVAVRGRTTAGSPPPRWSIPSQRYSTVPSARSTAGRPSARPAWPSTHHSRVPLARSIAGRPSMRPINPLTTHMRVPLAYSIAGRPSPRSCAPLLNHSRLPFDHSAAGSPPSRCRTPLRFQNRFPGLVNNGRWIVRVASPSDQAGCVGVRPVGAYAPPLRVGYPSWSAAPLDQRPVVLVTKRRWHCGPVALSDRWWRRTGIDQSSLSA